MKELFEFIAVLFSGGGRFILSVFLIAIGAIVVLNPHNQVALAAGIISLIAGIFFLVRAFTKK